MAATVVVAALALPIGALAASQSVYLTNAEKFRGYTTSISASKGATGSASIWIYLSKKTQSHSFSFDAPRSAFTMTSTLSSGTIKFNSIAPKSANGVVAAALGAYGGGTINFASTGAVKSKNCQNGGKQKTRPERRTSGKLTFSPSKKAGDRYSRTSFSGFASSVTNGDGYCQTPTPPITCTHYIGLSSYDFSGGTSVSATRRNMTSTGLFVYYTYSPSGSSIAPATAVSHSRNVTVAGSRLSVPDTNTLQTANLNMNGITGWTGTLHFSAPSPATAFGGACPYKSASGPTTGSLKGGLDFVNEPAHTGTAFANLRKQ